MQDLVPRIGANVSGRRIHDPIIGSNYLIQFSLNHVTSQNIYERRLCRMIIFYEMADDKVVIALAVYLMEKEKEKVIPKKRRTRSEWVKPYLAERTVKSQYHLVQDLSIRLQDKEEFKAYLRMDTATYMVRICFVL